MTRIAIWARPGAAIDSVVWEPWRRRWVVACRAAPEHGEANRAITALLAAWLNVAPERVRLVRGPRSRAKEFEIDGRTDAEVADRLQLAAARGAV